MPDTLLAPRPVLEIAAATKRYGGVTALDAVTLTVSPGESLGVIGPNGAGKSTLIGLVSGALPASAGAVLLHGQDVTKLGATERTRRGIGRTHQIPRPFARMTVLENLTLAGRHGPNRERVSTTRQRCEAILERTGLADFAHLDAGGLPLLRRKRLELARALALQPRLLLLDEIGAGLVEHETQELIALILEIRKEVEALVLIEHVMDVIVACCERTAVLDFGKLIAQGSTRDVLNDPNVAAVYLGDAAPSSAAKQVTVVRPRPSSTDSALLELQDVHVQFGGVRALRGVSLTVAAGEVVSLLGPNGAGKTTLARAISSAVTLDQGQISFKGARLDQLPPDQVAQAGVAHCMEGRKIFGTLTLEENLLLAAGSASRVKTRERLASTYQVFPDLVAHRSKPGTAMSGGQQQMLAIGRALMAAPSLVILDEVSLGLAPIAVDRLYESLQGIRVSGVAMLLVEQSLERGLSLADRAYVLTHGQIALSGTPAQIRAHGSLHALYVGDYST